MMEKDETQSTQETGTDDPSRQELIGFIVTRLVRVPTENLLDIVHALEAAEARNQTPSLRLIKEV